MSKTNNIEHYGQAHLTAKDIKRCRDELSDIIIAPYISGHAKGVGYNFSLSEMVYSVTHKRLVTIRHNGNETYFYLKPHDTVLALSYEYLKVDDCIAGDFHSRVRMTAMGVGSTSTTVDPGWNGMLLFSLNNPTRKRIKIILSTNEDGIQKQHPVLTLVVRRTIKPAKLSGDSGHEGDISLHLENPPMRTDIWSELVDRPIRLFQNQEYQRFMKLVHALSSFDSTPSPAVQWAAPLRDLLTNLVVAISSERNPESIHTTLIQIKAQVNLPQEMARRLDLLTECLSELPDDGSHDCLLDTCSDPKYLTGIDLAIREIEYQLLSDQVEQIHALISKSVPTSWKRTALAFLWHHAKKNIGVILSSCYLLALLCYGQSDTNVDFWNNFLLSFIPSFFSMGCSIYSEQK